MDKVYLRCNVCLMDYSDERTPCNLECGHAVCSSCLENILSRRICRECSQIFQDENDYDLVLNYPLLALLKLRTFTKLNLEEISGPQLIVRQPSTRSLKSAGTCSVHSRPMFFMCLRCKVLVCRDCLAVDHPDPPRGPCLILYIQEALDKIKASHLKTLKSYIVDAENTISELRHFIHGCDAIIRYSANEKYTDVTEDYRQDIQAVTRKRQETEEELNVLEIIPDSLRQATDKMAEAFSREDVLEADKTCINCQLIHEKRVIKERDQQIHVFLKMFLHGKKDLTDLLESGKPVYAILEEKGTRRWSEVVSKDNKILLYSLRDGTLPGDGLNVPYEIWRALVPQVSPTVFLDVGWEGRYQGRVCFRMYGNTPRGRQAVLLCSGERGPSYRNTLFHGIRAVEDEDHMCVEGEGDRLCFDGGDYENNDGTGGRAIVDDITNDEVYRRKIRGGMIAGWPAEDTHRLGCFSFYPFAEDLVHDYVFGRVVDPFEFFHRIDFGGRDFVGDEYPIVMDCGLVLTS